VERRRPEAPRRARGHGSQRRLRDQRLRPRRRRLRVEHDRLARDLLGRRDRRAAPDRADQGQRDRGLQLRDRRLGQILANEDESLKGWYLWPGPTGAGAKLDLTPFPQGSYYLSGADTPQFRTDLASDGTVLGYKGTVSSPSYYLRLPNGTETPVNGLIGHNGVNAKHTVIGTILGTYNGQTVPHAAIWKPDGTVIDLNSLLPANSDYVLGDALAINDNGDIVGVAGQISTQQDVGFLLPAGFVVDGTGDEADASPATATA
jgi:hypothetical protein